MVPKNPKHNVGNLNTLRNDSNNNKDDDDDDDDDDKNNILDIGSDCDCFRQEIMNFCECYEMMGGKSQNSMSSIDPTIIFILIYYCPKR
jgi:hypothetical protein